MFTKSQFWFCWIYRQCFSSKRNSCCFSWTKTKLSILSSITEAHEVRFSWNVDKYPKMDLTEKDGSYGKKKFHKNYAKQITKTYWATCYYCTHFYKYLTYITIKSVPTTHGCSNSPNATAEKDAHEAEHINLFLCGSLCSFPLAAPPGAIANTPSQKSTARRIHSIKYVTTRQRTTSSLFGAASPTSRTVVGSQLECERSRWDTTFVINKV